MRNAPADKIMDACKKARLHDFIMSLPNEYDTEIGENQPVGIAPYRWRSIVQAAPVCRMANWLEGTCGAGGKKRL